MNLENPHQPPQNLQHGLDKQSDPKESVKGIIDQFRDIYFPDGSPNGEENEENTQKLEKLAQELLAYDPGFKEYYDRSHKVISNSFYANADALGDYGRERGHQELGMA